MMNVEKQLNRSNFFFALLTYHPEKKWSAPTNNKSQQNLFLQRNYKLK